MVDKKLDKLRKILRNMGSVLVAYSGGTDSSFLLKVASDELGEKAVAATAVSELYIRDEYERAKKLSKELGVRHIVFQVNPLEMRNFSDNPVNRCYFCKRKMLGRLKRIARVEEIDYVVEGTNLDDEAEFRPGKKAVGELGIRSPLVEAGLKKEDIRYLSRQMGLFTWAEPSSSCLATRVPYGEEITLEKLKMIAKGEKFIKDLGVRDVRLRCLQGSIARIESRQDDRERLTRPAVREKIVNRLKKMGYFDVTFGAR